MLASYCCERAAPTHRSFEINRYCPQLEPVCHTLFESQSATRRKRSYCWLYPQLSLHSSLDSIVNTLRLTMFFFLLRCLSGDGAHSNNEEDETMKQPLLQRDGPTSDLPTEADERTTSMQRGSIYRWKHRSRPQNKQQLKLQLRDLQTLLKSSALEIMEQEKLLIEKTVNAQDVLEDLNELSKQHCMMSPQEALSCTL